MHFCAQNQVPWIRVGDGRLSAASKRAIDSLFLHLGGVLFFTHVDPMKSRSKMPRRGYGEFVSEIVSFARQAEKLADMWRGEHAIEALAAGVRRISGFGGKGFRMKEIILDVAEVTRSERQEIDEQLLDFAVVGPGPRRTLNFINNRRFFDNEFDHSPAAEAMYIEELRNFKRYLQQHTTIAQLRSLNLLGVQFALCEASKYFFLPAL